MPQELKQVNGRWVVTGAQRSSDLVPVARPRPATSSTPAAKPKAKPPQRPWWSKLLNDVQYELKRTSRTPAQAARARSLTPTQAALEYFNTQTATPGLGRLGEQIALGVVGATANALRMGYSVNQRAPRWLGGQAKPKADANSGAFGSGINRAVEAIYPLLNAKPPSQMSQDERNIDGMRNSLALNLLLARVSPGLGAASAATALGMGVRGGAALALNEALSTFLDDNTSANVVDLINMIPGVSLPGGVNVGQDDMVDAALKSFLPNAAASLGLGVGAGAAVTGFKNIRRNVRARRAVQQEAKHRARQEAMGVLQKDEADGLDFTPEVKQPPEPAPPPREQSFAEANAAMEERLGMRKPAPAGPAATPAPAAAAPEPTPIPSIENATTENFGKARDAATQPLPEGSLDEDVWGGVYDPSLPESTTISKVWEELSDTEINTVLSNPGTPVIERLNQVLEARQGLDAPPPLDSGMVMAPTDKLATDYLDTAVGKLQGREVWQLQPLFDPDTNSALWQRAQSLSGVDEPAQLTKADMVETLQAYATEAGQIPIVNRMMGAQMLPTAEITPAPQVFQYKGGVNDAGEQIGNSLSGVERWDPNAEGIIQVWRDGAGEIGDAGKVYVVNGHNRLAAATRMGIPSMRVEFLDAPTAAEARLQGAISNVSDGKGTVFDAAKLAREYGIADPAQLKALGKPGASGFWKEGIAMGRLPEDVFTAAVNEQIPLRRAVIIGESGADEETMRSAYRYLVQQGPENVKEGTLREMLAMAKRSPAASSVDQPDILTGTEWAQDFNAGMLAKADLAAAVRLMLSKEKKLFGTVGRQAGQIERVGQVDAGAAKDISGEASRALALFDQLKYQTGPVSDLLNEGTQRILAGEQSAQVAKGIKNRLAASIAEAMGKEVAPVTDAVQEDMFAAAARQADEQPAPVELSQAERDAGEAQVLQEAIAEGEVRPPSTPIPDLPDPPQVRLDEVADEPLETRGQGRFFHGAADEFTLEPGGEFGGDGMNIYGDGLYVTDDLMTAAKYRKKNAQRGSAGQGGVVYEVTEKAPVRLLDLDQPASKKILRELRRGSKYEQEWIEQAIEDAGDGASLGNIMDELRAWSRAFNLPAYEVQESFQSFFNRLEKLGYGGLTHQGGHLAGRGKRLHQVRIYWNPAESVEIRKIDPYDSPLAPGSKAAQAMADEIRLAVEHRQADAALQFEQQQALRDAVEYEGLTFEQKKDMGLTEGVDAPAAGSLAPADGKMGAAPSLAPAPIRPEPLRLTTPAAQPELLLPQDLRKASPRYGVNTVTFQSDLDHAAYVLANDAAKPSKAAGKFRQVVQEAGLNLDEVVAHGKRVKAALKQAAKGNPGQIELPAQPWRGDRAGGTQRVAQRSGSESDLDQLRAEMAALRAELDPKDRVPELIAAWRKVVGDDVRIRVLDTYKIDATSAAWGGDGEELSDVAAMYQHWKDTIHIYRFYAPLEEGGSPVVQTFQELLLNGFHESFHRIARMAMTDKDMAILNTRLARLKASKAMSDWGGEQATTAYDELLTEAAARVFTARFNGQDPVRAILPTATGVTNDITTSRPAKAFYRAVEAVVRALNKVYDFIERSYNLFQGRGFESISSVFDRAARGEMRNTIDALTLDRATRSYQTMPGLARGAKVAYWVNYNVFGDPITDGKPWRSGFNQGLFDEDTMDLPMSTKAGAQRVRQQIDAIDQSMTDIRRKAQQEGC